MPRKITLFETSCLIVFTEPVEGPGSLFQITRIICNVLSLVLPLHCIWCAVRSLLFGALKRAEV
jgi:hypothetical protein